MEEAEKVLLLSKIGASFTPSAPVDRLQLFAGRSQQVLEVLNAINQRGQHVVLYGERGVGKTSLANVVGQVSARSNNNVDTTVVSVNCDRSDTFERLWRKVLREIAFRFERPTLGFTGEPQQEALGLDQMLPQEPGPEDIRYLFERLDRRVIVILDEFDRVSDGQTTALIADAIKTLSDHSTSVTLILVGVADSVDDLIREHASVERSLVQVRMPRMSDAELREIISKGLSAVDMTIEEGVAQEIVELSLGLPHYTHLLALYAAQEAAHVGRRSIDMNDMDTAVSQAMTRAQQSIQRAYYSATSSPRRESLYEEVLLACALTQTDDLGYFAAADVREPLSGVMGKPYGIAAYSRHLDEFSTTRGPVLQKVGTPRKYRFRFRNPMMQPYILMRGWDRGMLPGEDELLA